MSERFVRCFCGSAEVVTRRPPEFDRFAICSPSCYDDLKRRHPNALLLITGEVKVD